MDGPPGRSLFVGTLALGRERGTIRRSRPDFSFTYKFDEVKHNIAVEDSKFNKPAPQ